MELWKGWFEFYYAGHWRALSSSFTYKGCYNYKTMQNCLSFGFVRCASILPCIKHAIF